MMASVWRSEDVTGKEHLWTWLKGKSSSSLGGQVGQDQSVPYRRNRGANVFEEQARGLLTKGGECEYRCLFLRLTISQNLSFSPFPNLSWHLFVLTTSAGPVTGWGGRSPQASSTLLATFLHCFLGGQGNSIPVAQSLRPRKVAKFWWVCLRKLNHGLGSCSLEGLSPRGLLPSQVAHFFVRDGTESFYPSQCEWFLDQIILCSTII